MFKLVIIYLIYCFLCFVTSATKVQKKKQPCKKTYARIWSPYQIRALKNHNAVIIQFGKQNLVLSFYYRIFAAMFEKEIKEYEDIRKEYQQKIADRMGKKEWMEYNEILFSAHSCAIEGNSFTVDDTRILREQGMAMHSAIEHLTPSLANTPQRMWLLVIPFLEITKR